MSDGIMSVLQFAIDAVSAQQNATANNLANSETPDYRASEVTFESSLQAAIDAPEGGTATTTSTTSDAAPATDGNNVDLGTELTNAEQETLHYSALSEAITGQFKLIGGVAGGSFS